MSTIKSQDSKERFTPLQYVIINKLSFICLLCTGSDKAVEGILQEARHRRHPATRGSQLHRTRAQPTRSACRAQPHGRRKRCTFCI